MTMEHKSLNQGSISNTSSSIALCVEDMRCLTEWLNMSVFDNYMGVLINEGAYVNVLEVPATFVSQSLGSLHYSNMIGCPQHPEMA